MVKGLRVRQCFILFSHTLAALEKVGAEPSDGGSTYTVPCGEYMYMSNVVVKGNKVLGFLKRNLQVG